MKSRMFTLLAVGVLGAGIVCSTTWVDSKENDIQTVKLKRYSCIDKQGIGIEAFSMLMPSDWKFNGGIKWILDNPGMPAVAAFTLSNPAGREEFEVFPNQSMWWTDNQMALSITPIGSRYFGMEVRPPVGPLEALKGIVLPRFRQNVQGLKVTSEQLLPDLAKSVGAGTQTQPGVTASASGGKLRILYTKNGMPMEEEIYGVVEKISFPIQTMTGVHTNLMWTVDYIFSFKSDQGKLDSHAKLFQTIVTSFKVNPKWFNKYNQVVEYLIQAQIKHIQNVGQLSRIISQTHNEISDQMMKSYEDRQKVYDKISDNFSHHIRGVDEYYNPLEGKTVELPSGYDNVWTNNLGEYVLSESPSYNPNIGSNLNWQKIEQTH